MVTCIQCTYLYPPETSLQQFPLPNYIFLLLQDDFSDNHGNSYGDEAPQNIEDTHTNGVFSNVVYQNI